MISLLILSSKFVLFDNFFKIYFMDLCPISDLMKNFDDFIANFGAQKLMYCDLFLTCYLGFDQHLTYNDDFFL